MKGLTVIVLKSLGLVAPVDLGIYVTISILNGDGGKPVNKPATTTYGPQSQCS